MEAFDFTQSWNGDGFSQHFQSHSIRKGVRLVTSYPLLGKIKKIKFKSKRIISNQIKWHFIDQAFRDIQHSKLGTYFTIVQISITKTDHSNPLIGNSVWQPYYGSRKVLTFFYNLFEFYVKIDNIKAQKVLLPLLAAKLHIHIKIIHRCRLTVCLYGRRGNIHTQHNCRKCKHSLGPVVNSNYHEFIGIYSVLVWRNGR